MFAGDRVGQVSTQSQERRVDGLYSASLARVAASHQVRRLVAVWHVLVAGPTQPSVPPGHTHTHGVPAAVLGYSQVDR